jgi:hypothetical protein
MAIASPPQTPARRAAWRAYALGGAAAAWFAHLNVSYLLVPFSCRMGTLALHAATLVALVLATGSGLAAWRLWRTGHGETAASAGRVGVLLAGLFGLTILVTGATNLVVDACH